MNQQDIDKQALLEKFGDEYNPFVAIGKLIGPDALGVVLRELGGQKPHVPTDENFYSSLCREARNKDMRAQFTGDNYGQLALDYDLTERMVRKIINTPKKSYARPPEAKVSAKLSLANGEAVADFAERFGVTNFAVLDVIVAQALAHCDIEGVLRERFGEQVALDMAS